MRACVVARNASGALLERADSEYGVSVVQYAVLMALVALVVSVLAGALGSGHRGLFGEMHTCMTGIKTVACKVGPALGGSAAHGKP
jgi:Flp pilus assembly pilin Flp